MEKQYLLRWTDHGVSMIIMSESEKDNFNSAISEIKKKYGYNDETEWSDFEEYEDDGDMDISFALAGGNDEQSYYCVGSLIDSYDIEEITLDEMEVLRKFEAIKTLSEKPAFCNASYFVRRILKHDMDNFDYYEQDD